MQLAGKTAIITGASSGIGRAAALLFAREGANVVAAARRGAELDALVAEIGAAGGRAVRLAGDVREAGFAGALTRLAIEEFGRLDIAFNNAGALAPPTAAHDVSLADWNDMLAVNLTGAFLCAQAQAPAMLKGGGGSMIFTSTFVGHTVGFPGMAAYASSKAGLNGLAQVLAAEYGAQGLRVNVILAGGTDTPMGAVVANTPEAQAAVAGLHALKRTAKPEEIANAALFLASDAASFITGAAIPVEGGVSISRS